MICVPWHPTDEIYCDISISNLRLRAAAHVKLLLRSRLFGVERGNVSGDLQARIYSVALRKKDSWEFIIAGDQSDADC